MQSTKDCSGHGNVGQSAAISGRSASNWIKAAIERLRASIGPNRHTRKCAALLERRIQTAYRRFLSAPNKDAQRAAYTEMTALIKQRSPEQIKQMELEKGLRVGP